MNAHRIRSLPLIRRCATPSPEGKALKRSIVDDVISTEAGVLTRTQRRNPPRSASRRRQVGWRGYASGISFPRDCHVARYAPRNDSGDVCVRLFYTVIPLVLRCHFDRSEGFNPNVAEKSPRSKGISSVYDSSRSSSGNRLQRVRFYGVNLHISAKKETVG